VHMLTLFSPAKINLFLRILRKRSDGFHELASLFQTVDLCDTLHFSLNSKDELICSDPSIPCDSSNLVLKASALFRRKTGIGVGLKVILEKRIPAQAGLGGGSSNAATTLWALNALCNRPVALPQLMEWGSELGSDVPFFLSQGTAYCTGRGEHVECLAPLPAPTLRVFLAKPKEGLSTPAVYQNLKLAQLVSQGQEQDQDPKILLHGFLKGKPTYINDLEAPAFKVMPSLADFKAKLVASGFEHVLLSGSGSSFFCLGNGALSPAEGGVTASVHFLNRPSDVWYSASV